MKRLIAAVLAGSCLLASGADMPPDITAPMTESSENNVTGHDRAVGTFLEYNNWIEPADFKDDVDLAYTACSTHGALDVNVGSIGLLYEKRDDGIWITSPYVPISKNKDVCSEGLKKLYAADKIGDYAAEYLAGFVAACDNVSVYIPATIDGTPVVGIADGAFSDCDGLTAVYIPHTVKSLDLSVFNKDAKTLVAGFEGSVVDSVSKEEYSGAVGCVVSPFDANIDGDVNSSDAMNILRMSVDMEVNPDSEYVRAVADGNGDGQVDSGDALIALRISVDIDSASNYYDNHPYTYNVTSVGKG